MTNLERNKKLKGIQTLLAEMIEAAKPSKPPPDIKPYENYYKWSKQYYWHKQLTTINKILNSAIEHFLDPEDLHIGD